MVTVGFPTLWQKSICPWRQFCFIRSFGIHSWWCVMNGTERIIFLSGLASNTPSNLTFYHPKRTVNLKFKKLFYCLSNWTRAKWGAHSILLSNPNEQATSLVFLTFHSVFTTMQHSYYLHFAEGEREIIFSTSHSHHLSTFPVWYHSPLNLQ